MDWQGIATAIGGVAAALGGAKRFTGKAHRMRERINHDVELLTRLDPQSPGHQHLREHIDASIQYLVSLDKRTEQSRTDPYGLILIVMFAGAAVACGVTVWLTEYGWGWDLLLIGGAVMFTVLVLAGSAVTFRQPVAPDGSKIEKN